ncbi:ran GTPase-activating protein 1 [Parasteatoda tepidariorum]|uniref:ran GTPase-activating protein 1 n=1 Tax=Parasteatoda tepidariorum TaxID=114398 RepID=UPI00077FAD82|nr:ran GTPase-activating protein 1 [Parasteatoda tepidariorum]
MSEIDNLADQLSSTKVEDVEKEVSFVGQGLSLDTAKDAAQIVEAIQNCPGMTTLKLEGNTFGIPAAEAVGKALESQQNFRKALWKDMFTRRSKDEIPKALTFLSNGIMTAKAQLVVLDLSDNAFGPRGLVGLQDLLQSSSCYTLQELHLNNNGLGISGAKMLSEAICNCIENSRKHGTPLSLKIFVCGRNRLENEGAKAVSKFIKQLGSLESVAMPQNGIYSPGVTRLAEAFRCNPNLTVINLNDNSLTEEGAKLIAGCLPSLKQLQLLNLGDCLLRNEGAKVLAKSLQVNCEHLIELNLGFNEIEKDGGLAIVKAIENKYTLQSLILNGNQFGNVGCQLIEDKMKDINKLDFLSSLSEDEGDEDDDDDYDGDEEHEDEHADDEEYIVDEEDEETDTEDDDSVEEKELTQKSYQSPMFRVTTPADFIANPSVEGLVSLEKSNIALKAILPENPTLNDSLELFMKVALTLNPENTAEKETACKFSDYILSQAFKTANISEFNNTFLVHINLLKGEDKKPKKNLDISGALAILEHSVRQPYFHASTRDLLQFFLSRPLPYASTSEKIKHSLMQALYQV